VSGSDGSASERKKREAETQFFWKKMKERSEKREKKEKRERKKNLSPQKLEKKKKEKKEDSPLLSDCVELLFFLVVCCFSPLG
jgi:hypothetical protein